MPDHFPLSTEPVEVDLGKVIQEAYTRASIDGCAPDEALARAETAIRTATSTRPLLVLFHRTLWRGCSHKKSFCINASAR